MVIRMADGRTAALDYREIAPLAATRDMYLDASGQAHGQERRRTARVGRAGRRRRADGGAREVRHDVARRRDGAGDPTRRARVRRRQRARSLVRGTPQQLIEQFDGAAVFLPNGAAARAPARRSSSPTLARTLRAIAEQGADAFYDGRDRRALVAARCGAAAGSSRWRISRATSPCGATPIRSTYRGYTLLTMPPSSSGGVTITETLNILEGYDSLPPFGSAG